MAEVQAVVPFAVPVPELIDEWESRPVNRYRKVPGSPSHRDRPMAASGGNVARSIASRWRGCAALKRCALRTGFTPGWDSSGCPNATGTDARYDAAGCRQGQFL